MRKRRITQRDLARRLGLSRSTVAAALNPSSRVKLTGETRRRVAQAAEKWRYRPDRHARVMRGGKSGLVGILHFGGLLQVAAERVFHATEALRRAGFECLAADLSWNASFCEPTCLSMIDARVEGVIVAGLDSLAALPALDHFRATRIPVVALSGNPVPGAPHFRGDAAGAYFELTRHFLARGHRRLAQMVSRSPADGHRRVYTWAGSERVRGFDAALRKARGQVVSRFPRAESSQPLGILVDAVLSEDPFDLFEAGYRCMRKILAQSIPPTAVLCGNDEIAYGAMRACRENNIAIPSRIAICGYDDIALSRYCEIPLTTVQQPNQEMAEAAVQTLLKWIEGNPPKPSQMAKAFPGELKIRASSGTCPAL
jgi:DNA-binding LacI/PurR family transcriptional regulator